MPSPQKHPVDPAQVHARLLTTLADLEAQRDAIIRTFPSYTSSRSPRNMDDGAAASNTPPKAQSESASEELTEQPVTPQDTAEALLLARTTIKRHIRLLHGYNEIRDVGQGLFGILAEQKGVRIVQVMEEFGVGVDD